jgi:hypothetical protein
MYEKKEYDMEEATLTQPTYIRSFVHSSSLLKLMVDTTRLTHTHTSYAMREASLFLCAFFETIMRWVRESESERRRGVKVF